MTCTTRIVLALLASLVGSLSAPAQEGESLPDLRRQVYRAFAAKDYARAEALALKLVELAPPSPADHYNLACARARQGKVEPAVAALEKAVKLGYADPLHMLDDEDLQALRSHAAFVDLLLAARANQKGAEAAGRYEPGAEIEGVKTLEGDPEQGLRWRLRMSPGADRENPQKLLIWLHPSGGSMNRRIEALAPRLNRAGYALLVLTQKRFSGWSGEDMRRLFTHTLPALKGIEGLDRERPVLLGYSAGGQAALQTWAKDAGRLGGLILDAAYPIDTGAYRQGKVQALPLPAGEAVRQVPLFVLVGARDGGARIWRQVAEPWRKAGVPLVLHEVPDKGHTWLVGPEQLTLLEGWLKQVAGGGRPGREPQEGTGGSDR